MVKSVLLENQLGAVYHMSWVIGKSGDENSTSGLVM